jgi:two-component system chemotaxis response regulator CheY
VSLISVNSRGPILLVEDHADLREAMTSLLEASGYAVVAAADGDEALDRLRRGTAPCLIVLDLEMPRKNGWEFRSEQIHDPKLAAIPTIVSSADDDVKQKAASLGIDGYFEKRGGFQGLLDLVARYALSSGGTTSGQQGLGNDAGQFPADASAPPFRRRAARRVPRPT